MQAKDVTSQLLLCHVHARLPISSSRFPASELVCLVLVVSSEIHALAQTSNVQNGERCRCSSICLAFMT